MPPVHPDRDLYLDPEMVTRDDAPEPDVPELPTVCECQTCQDECCRPSAMMADIWSRT